jgi:phosphoribosylformylglycinamidine synthase PurS subunit
VGEGRATERAMFKAQITITLKPTVLDAQGATVQRALHNLGYQSADQVRMGKYVELLVDSGEEAAARKQVDEMCRQLLVNPIIEEYRFELVQVEL